MFTKVKTKPELEAIRTSGGILAAVLRYLEQNISAGMTELDAADMAARELKALGGKPVFLGYGGPANGFPNIICISVNEKVVHGIPGDYQLKNGDIASFDFGVNFNGMITDSALTTIVGGGGDGEAKRLVTSTEAAMLAGIDQIKDRCHVGDIGAAVEAVLKQNKLGIVRELVGHGVGHHLHEGPDIPNYGRAGTGPQLKSGMTVAIEPMANLGGDDVIGHEDGWSILTADGSLSAHFEHTVLVTDDGFEILTLR